MTVWSLAPTMVHPGLLQPDHRLPQLVVGVTDLEPEVVEAEPPAAGWAAAPSPTSMSSSSWWVRPEVKAAAGIPRVAGKAASHPRTSP